MAARGEEVAGGVTVIKIKFRVFKLNVESCAEAAVVVAVVRVVAQAAGVKSRAISAKSLVRTGIHWGDRGTGKQGCARAMRPFVSSWFCTRCFFRNAWCVYVPVQVITFVTVPRRRSVIGAVIFKILRNTRR